MAQMPDTAVSIGTSTRLYSRVLGAVPAPALMTPDEGASAKNLPRFPVRLRSHFAYAAAAACSATHTLIVVAIPNKRSPPTDVPEDVADGTGGDAFLDFIVKVALAKRTTRSMKTHCSRGLRHSVRTSPPRLRLESRTMPQRESHYFYMSAGDDEPGIRASVGKMAGVIAKAPPGLEWHEEYLPGEDHGSTPYVTLYHGLRGFFANWNPTALIEAGGLPGCALPVARAWLRDLTRRHRLLRPWSRAARQGAQRD